MTFNSDRLSSQTKEWREHPARCLIPTKHPFETIHDNIILVVLVSCTFAIRGTYHFILLTKAIAGAANFHV